MLEIEIFIKGLIIGFFASMPVGPIAILCIQKTLNKGIWHGFATGVGAAASDLCYAILACFGMSFIVSFLKMHQNWFQIVGCVVLFIFGYFIYRTNPVKQLSPTQATKKQSYWQDAGAAFLLTITNPMIIILLMGLFAQFGFVTDQTSLLQSIIGLLGVLIGASAWWFALVSIVNLFRSQFNVRGLWLINKITGIVIFIVSIVGIITTIMGEKFL